MREFQLFCPLYKSYKLLKRYLRSCSIIKCKHKFVSSYNQLYRGATTCYRLCPIIPNDPSSCDHMLQV